MSVATLFRMVWFLLSMVAQVYNMASLATPQNCVRCSVPITEPSGNDCYCIACVDIGVPTTEELEKLVRCSQCTQLARMKHTYQCEICHRQGCFKCEFKGVGGSHTYYHSKCIDKANDPKCICDELPLVSSMRHLYGGEWFFCALCDHDLEVQCHGCKIFHPAPALEKCVSCHGACYSNCLAANPEFAWCWQCCSSSCSSSNNSNSSSFEDWLR